MSMQLNDEFDTVVKTKFGSADSYMCSVTISGNVFVLVIVPLEFVVRKTKSVTVSVYYSPERVSPVGRAELEDLSISNISNTSFEQVSREQMRALHFRNSETTLSEMIITALNTGVCKVAERQEMQKEIEAEILASVEATKESHQSFDESVSAELDAESEQ